MGNYIVKNEETLIRLNNWGMDKFYAQLLEAATAIGCDDNEQLMEFIERLDQDTYGRGCIYVDITELNEKNKKILKGLVERVIKKIKQKDGTPDEYIELFLKLLEDFKNKIS